MIAGLTDAFVISGGRFACIHLANSSSTHPRARAPHTHTQTTHLHTHTYTTIPTIHPRFTHAHTLTPTLTYTHLHLRTYTRKPTATHTHRQITLTFTHTRLHELRVTIRDINGGAITAAEVWLRQATVWYPFTVSFTPRTSFAHALIPIGSDLRCGTHTLTHTHTRTHALA